MLLRHLLVEKAPRAPDIKCEVQGTACGIFGPRCSDIERLSSPNRQRCHFFGVEQAYACAIS
jgi:hypothetical protein